MRKIVVALSAVVLNACATHSVEKTPGMKDLPKIEVTWVSEVVRPWMEPGKPAQDRRFVLARTTRGLQAPLQKVVVDSGEPERALKAEGKETCEPFTVSMTPENRRAWMSFCQGQPDTEWDWRVIAETTIPRDLSTSCAPGWLGSK